MEKIITLDEYIIKHQRRHQDATGELSGLLRNIGVSAKIVNRVVNKAGLTQYLGQEGITNATGDEVQKLDMYANSLLIEYLLNSGDCAAVASEELDDIVAAEPSKHNPAKYIVVMDPLDGSSNIDVNISVGTIFGIYARISDVNQKCTSKDFLRKGLEMVAAGYVLYGTSTMFVYTTGHGVQGFTLDLSIGEFCLSHKDMRIPSTGKYYSINQGYYGQFEQGIKDFINICAEKHRPLRYIGSMVADVHRTLLIGGVFIYPGMTSHPEGKLRLLYECNPLGMIIEQAGGKAVSCDHHRILDIPVTHLHQKSSIIIGSLSLVDEVLSCLRQY